MKIKMNKGINVESDLQVKLKARINSVYWYNILKDLLKERLVINSSIILFYNQENDDIAQVLTQDVTDDE